MNGGQVALILDDVVKRYNNFVSDTTKMDTIDRNLGCKIIKNGSAMKWGIKNGGYKDKCLVDPNTTLHNWFCSIYKG